jgi:hypothetical protein
MARPISQFILKPGRLAEQAAILCGVLAGHVLVGILLCWSHQTPAPISGQEGQVALISLVEAMPATERQPIRQAKSKPVSKAMTLSQPAHNAVISEATPISPPEPAASQLSEADALAVEAFNPATAMGEPNSPCDLTATLAGVFAQSPEVQQGLAELPEAKRSVANAIMLWDGQWSPESQSGGHGLLRALLVKAVSAARPDCLLQSNKGPVLFLVPDHQTTVVLAIGSGEWHWGDLLADMPSAAPAMAVNNYFLSPASAVQAAP